MTSRGGRLLSRNAVADQVQFQASVLGEFERGAHTFSNERRHLDAALLYVENHGFVRRSLGRFRSPAWGLWYRFRSCVGNWLFRAYRGRNHGTLRRGGLDGFWRSGRCGRRFYRSGIREFE